uniref:Predicted protein n=1 Tax=Physcomitrium patens TaxID=3218 RepID=A9U4K3_PHYPA
MDKAGMSHAIDARLYKDEEEVDNGYKQSTNEKNGYNQRVRFEDYKNKEMKASSHYTRKYWIRVTIEVLVKVGDIEEPIVALIDHGSEINLMSKDLYNKQKGPIVMEHGWAIRAVNNTQRKLYGACPDMETKVLDDGSAYARVHSEDRRKAVQFLTIPPNYERNRDRLREKPLPRIVEGFKDFGEVPL